MKIYRLGWAISIMIVSFSFVAVEVSLGQSGNSSQKLSTRGAQEIRRSNVVPSIKPIEPRKQESRASTHPFSYIPENEIKVKTSYVFDAKFRKTATPEGKVAAHHVDFGFIATPNLNEDFQFRTGFELERSSFSYNRSNPVPNTLEGANLVLGFDWACYQDWLIRFEARPGIYTNGQSFNSNAFNTTFLLGASYFVNRDLNWLFGVTINPWREWPVIPGVGVRWAFAKDWQLNLLFPNPRVEYRVAPGIRIYGGGEWKSGSYRTDKNFGDTHGDASLNNAILEHREIRAGIGIIGQPSNLISLELQAGAMLDRRYDYFRSKKEIRAGMAPYIQLSAAFRF
jgi:hypothetical protein